VDVRTLTDADLHVFDAMFPRLLKFWAEVDDPSLMLAMCAMAAGRVLARSIDDQHTTMTVEDVVEDFRRGLVVGLEAERAAEDVRQERAHGGH
jgi:hypothetical protein